MIRKVMLLILFLFPQLNFASGDLFITYQYVTFDKFVSPTIGYDVEQPFGKIGVESKLSYAILPSYDGILKTQTSFSNGISYKLNDNTKLSLGYALDKLLYNTSYYKSIYITAKINLWN